MKTYSRSRKNSSYLKKAFVASNFNEMCRLCLSEVGLVLVPIFQVKPIQEWIQYGLDILVEEGDGLPSNICEECLQLLKQMYSFKNKCKASDSKLRDYLQLLNLKEECQFNDQLEDEVVEVAMCSKKDSFSGQTENTSTNSEHNKETEELSNNETISESIDNPTKCTVSSEQSEPSESILLQEMDNETTRIDNNTDSSLIFDKEENSKQNVELADENEEAVNKTDNIVIFIENTENPSTKPQETEHLATDPENTIQLQQTPINNCDVTVVKVFNLVENDANEIFVESEHQEIIRHPGRIQEICKLWDNDEEDIDLTEKSNDKFVVKEYEETMVFEVDSSSGNNHKAEESFEVQVEDNGVIKTHKVYVCENPTKRDVITDALNAPAIKCSRCDALVSSHSALRQHLISAHQETGELHICKLCFKNFTCATSLKRHMSVHTGAKPYMCEICKRRFSQSSILKRHKFTHISSKPFACHLCKKSYTQKMNLITHLRNHGFKPPKDHYKCKTCGKLFVHPSGLSRHIKLHKGVRPICNYCHKCFSDASALSRHVKTVHNLAK